MAERVEGKEFANQFSRFVNVIANDQEQEEAVNFMCRDHRTLQQSMVRFCLKFISKMAEKEGSHDFDARNEGAVKLCAKIVKECGDDMNYLPFI